MFLLLLALIFAAAASANVITTTFWMPRLAGGGSGWLGSVVDAEKDRVTLAVSISISDLGDITHTYTLAPTLWEQSTSNIFHNLPDQWSTRDNAVQHICERNTETPKPVVCTQSIGKYAAYAEHCLNPGAFYEDPLVDTYTFTYSENESSPSAVVTTEETIINPRSTPTPEWCSAQGESVPESAKSRAITLEKWDVRSYEIIVTAGVEKLSATAGQSTDTQRPRETGAAAPMKTLAPLAGLGAAVAAFML